MSEPSRAVFLSYASEDASAAQRICDSLRAAGVEVWFDKSELRGGDAWDRQIRRQIHDCALFVPIISAQSEARLEGYFRREWKLAVERTHDMADRMQFLVPVAIDDTKERDAEVPEGFRQVQWTRLTGGATPPAFVEHVRHLLSPDQKVAPARQAIVGAPDSPHAAHRGARHSDARSSTQLAIAAVLAAAVIAAGGYFAMTRLRPRAEIPRAPIATSAPSTIAEKSIAVLPFADLTEKHDQEYFCDGMAEQVIDLLANIPALKVIGRTPSFQFKGKNQDLREIGKALGVNYLAEGSVRKSADRLRITAQLINAGDGSHLWSETYDEPIGNVLNVQDDIASNVARALQVTVGGENTEPNRAAFKSKDAYDLYLRGQHAFDRFDKEGYDSAIAYFQRVLDLEPNFVPAIEWLAWAQEFSAELPTGNRQGFESARQTARRALALDPNSGESYAVLSKINLSYDWDWTAAERNASEAMRLIPGRSDGPAVLGNVYSAIGRWDEAVRSYKTALTLDPLDASVSSGLSGAFLALGRLHEADVAARKALQISPTLAGGEGAIAFILLWQGRFTDALAASQMEQLEDVRLYSLAMVYHAMGRHSDSDSVLAQLVRQHAQTSAYLIADVYAYRGEVSQAFAWLERAYTQKDLSLPFIKGDPVLMKMASDPRYKAILRKMNLPE